jgi:hypothetical protein
MTDLINVVSRTALLAVEAGHLAHDLEALMKDESDHPRRAVLHRLAGACRELALHTTHSLATISEISRNSASAKLSEVADAIKQAASSASDTDINKAALDRAAEKVGAVRAAVGKM